MIEKLTGVRCFGCGSKKPVTNKREQPLCSACNMLLRRKFGNEYEALVTDPARTVEEIRERKQEKRDIKMCRKLFFTLQTLADDFDLEDNERRLAFQAFANPLSVIEEAQPFLTFNRPVENVKAGHEHDAFDALSDVPD